MPFFKQIWLNTTTTLHLWELTEHAKDLLHQIELLTNEKKQLDTMRNEKRRAEFLASRILQKKVFPNETIVYSGNGAPYLINQTANISISHSNRFVCFMNSKFACGVDIEHISSKALRIARRFLSENELKFIHDEYPAKDATLLWCAKESLFKTLNRANINFSSQILIENIVNDGTKNIKASIITDKANSQHIINYDFIDEQVLTWVTDEKHQIYAHRTTEQN